LAIEKKDCYGDEEWKFFEKNSKHVIQYSYFLSRVPFKFNLGLKPDVNESAFVEGFYKKQNTYQRKIQKESNRRKSYVESYMANKA